MTDKVENSVNHEIKTDEQQIKEIVQKAIEEKLHDSFNNGIIYAISEYIIN